MSTYFSFTLFPPPPPLVDEPYRLSRTVVDFVVRIRENHQKTTWPIVAIRLECEGNPFVDHDIVHIVELHVLFRNQRSCVKQDHFPINFGVPNVDWNED